MSEIHLQRKRNPTANAADMNEVLSIGIVGFRPDNPQ
jgi:hypothetical protein